jgi:hypothetical protein
LKVWAKRTRNGNFFLKLPAIILIKSALLFEKLKMQQGKHILFESLFRFGSYFTHLLLKNQFFLPKFNKLLAQVFSMGNYCFT